ncbi:MAG: flagellar export protein FliJ [Spirochaetaceae bacterium]|jgi:flagellar export protein FliJ|nr:flagellar export protein FliJ [Spirochaetaceae bacterium]
MKKFSFRLEKVLKLRQHAENDAKVELGHAVSSLSRIENKLDAVAAARKNAGEHRFSGGNSLPYMHSYENYLRRLETEKEQLLKEAAAAALEAERARELWTEARAGLKVMENLKEKKYEAYRKESRPDG